MKIKDVIVEAGEEVVTPPAGYKPGAVTPAAGGQFSSDLASAIRAGAGGDMSFKKASEPNLERAPVGTKIGQWQKTPDGWVNSLNNSAANQTQANVLDKKWTGFAQQSAGKQAQDLKQQRIDQEVQDQAADQAADQQQQQQQPAQPTLVQTVITPTGKTVYLKSDKKWYHDDDDNSVVVDQSAIKQLNQMVINARELAKARGMKVPAVIKAQSTAPAVQTNKPHTGGRQKGGLSQTPNAIRKRAARAEMPAVFTSNRR